MRVSILLFDGFTILDAIGGYSVLNWLPEAEIEFVAETKGTIADDVRRAGLAAYRDFSEINETDLLYVPGGPGVAATATNQTVIDFIQRMHATSTWTVGVCNGVELLGAAGLLMDKTVTTNFFAREAVAAYGANVIPSRYHQDGKLITSGGVSASIDAMLFLARLIAGEDVGKALQLGIEYYPSPPFSYAGPDYVPKETRDLVEQVETTVAFERMNTANIPF